MARGFRLNCIGQTSVEFLFLFLIMLFYLQVVIQPAVNDSSASITTVNKVGQAKLAAMKLANSINEISALSGESSKTIWLFMESCTSVWCDDTDNKIYYSATANIGLEECAGSAYDGEIKLLDDIVLNCSNFHRINGFTTPKDKVRVWKLGGVVNVQNRLA